MPVSEAIDSLITVLYELKAKLGERELANTFEEATRFASAIRNQSKQ